VKAENPQPTYVNEGFLDRHIEENAVFVSEAIGYNILLFIIDI
jgi:hypothetical protein